MREDEGLEILKEFFKDTDIEVRGYYCSTCGGFHDITLVRGDKKITLEPECYDKEIAYIEVEDE